MKIKILLPLFIIFVITVTGCKIQEVDENILFYENKNMGISFNYPSSFTVYQPSAISLRIESDYRNEQLPIYHDYPGSFLIMNIERINSKQEDLEQIENRINPKKFNLRTEEEKVIGEKKDYKIIKKNNYDLVEVSDGNSYILTDKGTFFISDSTNIFKELLEQPGLYQKYSKQFDDIRKSIKII